MVSTSLFVSCNRPQKVLDHVLLSVLFLLSHTVTCTLTTNATTTAPGGQGFLSSTKIATQLISVPPTAVMNTSSTLHQVITSGTNNLTITSVANTTTTTTMSPQVIATAETTTGTKKPTNTSEVNTTTTTTATSLVTAFANATNVSGTNNLTITSVANTTTTTTMSPQVIATAETTTGTKKPTNTSEVNSTTTTIATSLVTAFANATNAPWLVHCNFSQNCDNDSVYYWMTISVEVNGAESNESDISAWLQNLFQNQSECSPTLPTITPLKINTYSPSGSSNGTTVNSRVSTSAPITAAITQNVSVSNGSETATNIVKDVTVMCTNKTAIRQTTCTVVLQLTQTISTCCIIQTVSTVQNKSSIQAYVVGDVEQVVKGICRSSAAGPPVGNFEKCNGSLSPDIICNSSTTVNVSCNGNSQTAYVSLAIPDQKNCTFETQQNTCNCSSYCNSTAAYYSLDIETSDFNVNMMQVISLILTNSTCNDTNPGCQALKNISKIYENSTVMCDITCTILLKLSKVIEVCLLRSALLGAFQNQSTMVTDITVTRVAICSWEDSLNADLLQSNILPVSVLLPDVCPIGKVNIVSNSCKNGTNIAVPLMERCNNIPVNSAATSMPSSTANTNVTKITNTASATNTSEATLDTTASTTSSTSAEATAEGLLNLSRNASALNSTQIQEVVSLLESLLSGPSVSLGLGNMSINIVSNLIDAPPNMLASSSNRITGIVDTVGLKLVVQGQSQSILSPSVALAVKLVDGALFPKTTFTITDPSNLQISSRLGRTEPSSPQGSITLPASLTGNLTAQQQQLASRVQFNFYQKTTLFQDHTLNPNNSRLISGILGSSVANLSISNLREQVVFTLKNTETVVVNSSRSCVFWKFNLSGGAGGWSSEGCTVLNHTETETICGCNHLTSFGVLLDLSGEGIKNRLQNTILTYITYIGCGISSIFLSVTLMTYLAFETLRKDIPSKIVIQLCLALLLLNLTFLLDAWLALYTNIVGLCISTAFFLHYFLLASFTWMAMEAVHMYISLVKVFNTYVSRYMVKLGLAGWGIPLIVVIIVIAIDENNYALVSYGKFEDGTSDQFCWLKNEIAYYVAVVAYFCVVFILNLSMFIVVMVQLCRIKRQNPHNLQHRSVLQDLRSVSGLTVLLGLTWGFAFFAWDAVNLPFMYLFAIFNSLQGFFIFVFHCAVKENVRKQWRIHLCCGNLRLVENSDWSHTATPRTKKSTVNRVASSFRSVISSKSNKSSSSFLVSDSSGSDRSMGIGNPLDDRAITEQEEPSSDVVQNEINHRYRSQRSF
ncbi:adhesion G-protein coupled receptor G2 isoform X2 [Ictalurus furcatus]|nr:adhesion G-protein coupled receptor G2 isoform X2 [Ictalurus furcatus]XP_053501215.1 adhesion G-protein coupled receptor G2 isoform X2 [Ictalurus furcatus]